MKKIISLLTLVIIPTFSFSEETTFEMLTGDTKLACEAIMCLSTPSSRPTECEPSLQRYFSITAKKAGDQARKRQNFLDQCPQDQSTQSSNNKGQ